MLTFLKNLLNRFKRRKSVKQIHVSASQQTKPPDTDDRYVLLHQPVTHVFHYPLPKNKNHPLLQWISEHGLPRDRVTTIRLLAIYDKRLPTLKELQAYDSKTDNLIWVRESRDKLFNLQRKQLCFPHSNSHQKLAVLAIANQ